ncbi:MAG: phosphodiesterase [Selenomonas sp.]|nr:phosphodiesterase [Selenomonas sp.]MCI7331502.1 phosphodiesterase [Selenomonadaceae bacterium]MDD6118925.1 phosphodiesterase [Selenomonadaceae bacterium]MDD7057286.1 phosphodiesterase [Selenomonadaceae bacterium]MDY3915780.1 phosphodiesterase [Selenomonadaceae bacterium]
MKIGVISDTHGHEMAWQNCFDKYFSDADLILHAGDVLYHGPRNPMKADYNPAGLVQRINSCPVPVVIARGNCDSEVDASCLELPVQAPYAYVYGQGKRIIITHGHTCMTNEEKDQLAAHLKADIFISGHIHTNVLEKRGNTIFLNPGSPALSKREDGRATCAVIADDAIRIYDIATDEVLMELKTHA